jgi:hypothetical protein
MRPISAVDSVSLAIQRTRDFLFRPFNWGTFLKLGLVAIITEGLGSNLHSSSSNSGQSSGHGPMINSPFDIPPVWIAASVAMLLLVMLVSMVVFYLVTRLRFAFFHCLIHNTKEIRPGWWLYRDQATRFFWMNLGVGFSFLLVVALIAIPFVSGFVRVFHQVREIGHPDWGLVLSLVLPLLPIILLLGLAGIALDVILRDWMLPHYALDDASAGEAWSRVWARIKAEKRQFIAYALLRLILPTLATIGVFIVLAIPGLILAGSVAAVEFGLHSAFADASGGSAVTGVLLQAFFGVLAFGFMLLASICLGGPVSTGTREYALMFYGGRYQALGDILYPPVPRSA